MKLKSTKLRSLLHSGESLGHPVYFATVAAFGNGPYALAAGVMAIITLLLLIIVSD